MCQGIITLSSTFEQVGVGITAGEKGKDKNKVVVVVSVDVGSPAAKSQKIFVDDSIVSIDHIEVSSAKQAHDCLQVSQQSKNPCCLRPRTSTQFYGVRAQHP
jgi:C-terminal processing protease CtpA/Prc